MTESAQVTSGGGTPHQASVVPTHGTTDLVLRIFALSVVAVALAFLVNSYLVHWRGWPGLFYFLGDLGVPGFTPPKTALDSSAVGLGWAQLLLFLGAIAACIVIVLSNRSRTLHEESERLTALATYIARAAFWAVFLVGIADALISFLRVEALLGNVVGDALAQDLGRSSFRGTYVLYPLVVVAMVIAFFSRSVGFMWLALLVVVAELQIVILRFIFSYEQAFMADLVRFWYAALFLFASAYTLLHEGHVRVDLLYAGFSVRRKAWSNLIGSLLLGVPVCWIILGLGMADKGGTIISPLLNFEVTQAGFGMYVKYFMAGFLIVYAVSMLVQFMSYFLNSAGILLHEPDSHLAQPEEAHF
ncbi:MAG: TRAP transporter small permease subunit [Alphaproteobacteria bacterium]|nr:TRAP transporter small permease subunit [Alphaproteobacteria bacterium]